MQETLKSWFSAVPSGMYRKFGTKVCNKSYMHDDDHDYHSFTDDDNGLDADDDGDHLDEKEDPCSLKRPFS